MRPHWTVLRDRYAGRRMPSWVVIYRPLGRGSNAKALVVARVGAHAEALAYATAQADAARKVFGA